MGNRPEGILAYGFDLAGGRVDWEFTTTAALPGRGVDWYGNENEESPDVVEQVEARLREHTGITFEPHSERDEPSYLLAAHVQRADWDGPTQIHMADLERLRIEQAWDMRLGSALQSLGIEPHQDGPRWLLLAYGS
ncbi:MAG: hypothetical protein QOF58_3410 [Pseudonocardiales bacterium]|nr:hypothetical protein [Pseudonocardiales bacterium]